MTVTSTLYTTSSYKITVSGEFVSNNIITAVNTAITSAALGSWSLYDGVPPSTIGSSYSTTGFSPIWTNVYRVLNTDGTTYKYFIIRWDTIKCCFYTSTCESWNSTSHVSTNETWTGAGVFPQYYDVRDSFIFLSASTKHCVIWPYIKNEPGLWTGVFEFERIASEDIAANTVPCFAWTNSLMLGTPYGRTNATRSNVMFAFPRTADGLTGAYAANTYAPMTSRGMFPPQYLTGSVTVTENNMLHLGSYPLMTYGWDATKTVASPVAADAQAKSMPFGRMYNVGITKSVGSFLDTTYLNLDASGGWPDAGGSNTEVILLPLNGGAEANTQAGLQLSSSYGTGGTVNFTKVIQVGSTIFAGATDGVRVWSVDSGTGTPTTALTGTSNVVSDVIFDGQDFVYAAGSNSVFKIQASNTANVVNVGLTSAVSNGAGYLSLDNNYLYISSRSSNTQPLFFSIPRNSFAAANLITTNELGANLIVASGFGTVTPDYNGYVYIATQSGNSTANQSFKILSFQATATNMVKVANVFQFSKSTNALAGGVYTNFHVDPTSGRVFIITSDSSVSGGYLYETNTSLSQISSNTTFLSTNGTIANYGSGLAVSQLPSGAGGQFDLRGELNIVPIRGMFHIQPKRAAANVSPTWVNKVHIISPQNTTATSGANGERIYANTLGVNIFTDAAGAPNGILTNNGPRTYFSDCNTVSNNTL